MKRVIRCEKIRGLIYVRLKIHNSLCGPPSPSPFSIWNFNSYGESTIEAQCLGETQAILYFRRLDSMRSQHDGYSWTGSVCDASWISERGIPGSSGNICGQDSACTLLAAPHVRIAWMEHIYVAKKVCNLTWNPLTTELDSIELHRDRRITNQHSAFKWGAFLWNLATND